MDISPFGGFITFEIESSDFFLNVELSYISYIFLNFTLMT